MKRPQRVPPGPGQASVWDYPRPPRLEPFRGHIEVIFNGRTILETERAYRALETSHPPTYYLPMGDVAEGVLVPSRRTSRCEWKGQASYFHVRVDDRQADDAAWTYPDPTPDFARIRDHVTFYPDPMDACYVDGERATPQPGRFYGGWITSDVVGPFKGEPGTRGW